MSPQEKAFRLYLAELARYLGRSPDRAQNAKDAVEKVYARLIRYSSKAHRH
jgi:hypothetical protein